MHSLNVNHMNLLFILASKLHILISRREGSPGSDFKYSTLRGLFSDAFNAPTSGLKKEGPYVQIFREKFKFSDRFIFLVHNFTF